MPDFQRSFTAKEPYNYRLFCEKWPATWGILRVLATLYQVKTYFDRREWGDCVKIRLHGRHDSFIRVTWLIHMWDMADWYLKHNACVCDTGLVDMWDMTHVYVAHNSIICVTRLTCMWHTTYVYVTHNWCARDNWLFRTCEWVTCHVRMSSVSHTNHTRLAYEWVMAHIWMSHVSRMNESRARDSWVRHDSFICDTWLMRIVGVTLCTGWRRLIGSPKLQIIFHKRAIKYRLLLREMACKDKGSYESSPPCICVETHSYVTHDSRVRETWLLHMWHMTHAYSRCGFVYLCHDLFVCDTWLTRTWDMTHSYVTYHSCV